ncbi:MAG: hypothetical protein IT436_08985 [Phycisphaerales bacterium]|nr:hypothetical protein [Phycisphaerales bacterium]
MRCAPRLAGLVLLAIPAMFAAPAAGQADPAPGRDTADHRERALMPAERLTKREPFRPSIHGFKFRNTFTGSPIPPRYRSLVSRLGLDLAIDTPATYGLCGGMSASAADFYLADLQVPAREAPPGDGDDLFNYLSDRQVDSLGPGFMLALKFAEWMAYDDHRPPTAPARAGRGTDIALETAKELPAIYDKLDNLDLVVLGLVYVKHGTGLLWENHQVLAYGYDRDETEARIRIYDPNYPGDDGVVIAIRPFEPGSEAVRCELIPTRRKARPVRGLFEMPYAARMPPEALQR